MNERQSAHDHPRSDEVKGRDRHDGEDERGVGVQGDFGDQGIDQSTDPRHAPSHHTAATGTEGADPNAPLPDIGSQAD